MAYNLLAAGATALEKRLFYVGFWRVLGPRGHLLDLRYGACREVGCCALAGEGLEECGRAVPRETDTEALRKAAQQLRQHGLGCASFPG